MKNFKQIAFGLLIGTLAIGFSAFTSAYKNSITIKKDANGKIISATTYFYNLDGNSADQTASNFVYKDPAVDPNAGCNSSSNECQAQWMTTNPPTNGQTPTAAGSPHYVGNGIETGKYNGQ